MKNVLLTALAAIVVLTTACKNLDENLNDSMAAEMEARQKGLTDYVARNQAIAEFNIAATNAPVSLYNDPSAGFATVKENISMIANKYQATVDAYGDHLSRLSRLQDDYRSGKIKTEEAKQEFESINSNFKAIENTFERADDFYKKSSDEYAAIMNTWKTAHPEEAAAMKDASGKPGGVSLPAGATSNSAANSVQMPANRDKDGNVIEESKKQ